MSESRFLLLLTIFALTCTLFVFVQQNWQYHHAAPAADCSSPYDYPICKRAVAPDATSPFSPSQLNKGLFVVAIASLLFLLVAWRSSVTEQKDLVVDARQETPRDPWQTPPAIPDNKQGETNG